MMRDFEPMRGWWSAGALCVVLSAVSAAQDASRVLAQAELQATLEALPPVEDELGNDGSWCPAPVVERLARHLEAGGTLSDAQWRLALLRAGVLRAHARWPVDAPFAVGMAVPRWLPRPTEVRAVPQRPEWQAANAGGLHLERCGTCAASQRRRERYQELGALPLGRHELVFDVTVERGDRGRELALDGAELRVAGDPLWHGELHLTVEVVPTLAEALPPAHDAGLDAAVRRLLDAHLYTFTHFYDVSLDLSADRAPFPELAALGLTLEVALVEDGARVHELGRVAVPERGENSRGRCSPWNLPCNKAELSRWSLRVRGVRGDALRSWNAERWWDGELVLPLEELLRPR